MGLLRAAIDASHSLDVEIRHDLHRHPELGYAETRTSGVVRNHLESQKIDLCGNLAGGTGVLGYLPATTNPEGARTIALRADMDALPIVEETGAEYQSTNRGVMHACGHDGHTTILMATARALSQMPERPNNVLFVFQPAEEGGAGGDRMCKEGVLNGRLMGKTADVIYGLHGNPWIELGHVSTRNGPLMASATELHITISGKGSHAAYPHLGIDPIVVASHVITALQTIASRSVDPLDSVVVTIGKVEAGLAHNVIPEKAHLSGTVRTLQDSTFALVKSRIVEIVRNVAAAFGAQGEAEFLGSYPVTFNHTEPTDRFREVARATLGSQFVHEEAAPSMGAEDFSFYGREVPACFYFLGLRSPEQTTYPNLHSPRFDFNDAAIPVGVELMCELALNG
ncbi:M20 metallopeptidase family protein [Fimbriimonas ginsengisoli]|uniref:Amidohydrolase n=1 Tax=Fimbriimonas ginsengisoli Gsoil 348 TaxID=661478 RepID=A0A068NYA7_FIMGI|nr:amidohydrolase [Fimbriimonas ginsengisoli]AIE86799.1 amidohydrolase [Fimbriimonas ginsengisoli Gsoil 348]